MSRCQVLRAQPPLARREGERPGPLRQLRQRRRRAHWARGLSLDRRSRLAVAAHMLGPGRFHDPPASDATSLADLMHSGFARETSCYMSRSGAKFSNAVAITAVASAERVMRSVARLQTVNVNLTFSELTLL